MAEGLSADEVGKEIAGHAAEGGDGEHDRRDRIVSITEAILLSVVALMAAWSGYAAAKWSTESRVDLAHSASVRSKASRADLKANARAAAAWKKDCGNRQAMAVAEHRFRPGFRVAFDAWRATKPETNPNAPRGPTYMPQYRQPGLREAAALDKQADEAFASGEDAGTRSDKYIRTTVFLASVLFLVGISTRFPLRGGRYALVGLGAVLLVISFVLLLQLPAPPA